RMRTDGQVAESGGHARRSGAALTTYRGVSDRRAQRSGVVATNSAAVAGAGVGSTPQPPDRPASRRRTPCLWPALGTVALRGLVGFDSLARSRVPAQPTPVSRR